MIRMAHGERATSILLTAGSILHESGVQAVTIVAIASRLGVSRQIIYTHFHTVEEILDSLYQRILNQHYTSVHPLDVGRDDFLDEVIYRVRHLFEMPVEDFTVVSLAFHASPNSDASTWRLNQKLREIAELNWIAPLVESGVDPVSALSGVYAIFGAAMQLRELVDSGRLTVTAAHAELERMTRAIMHESARPVHVAPRDEIHPQSPGSLRDSPIPRSW